MWLRTKIEANLKSLLKMKVVWNTCDNELYGEMKSAYENYLKFQSKTSKIHYFLEKIYVKYLEKNSIAAGILL